MSDEVKGFFVFMTIWGMLVFITAGCTERRLYRISRVLHSY